MSDPGKCRLNRGGLALSMLLLALAGCGSSPPVQLYQLRADPPAGSVITAPGVNAGERWALATVQLPDYLDRDALVIPKGQAGLQALSGHRWAEPLRDAVPRLLLADLARLRGTEQIWRTPLPPGVTVDRQLRVELRQFESAGDQAPRLLRLSARWVLADPAGRLAARVGETRLEVGVADASPDALVSAHRQALWQLAQAIDSWAGQAR